MAVARSETKVLLSRVPFAGHMGETPLSVNRVDTDGRVYLPAEVRERYIGDEMAMYEPEPGRIVLQRVEIEDE